MTEDGRCHLILLENNQLTISSYLSAYTPNDEPAS